VPARRGQAAGKEAGRRYAAAGDGGGKVKRRRVCVRVRGW